MAPRPVLAALQNQQREIASLRHVVAKQTLQLAFLANVAGLSTQFAAISKQADINNPGSPVPDPPEQAAVETEQQAMTPEASDDPTVMGLTPGSTQGVPAETTANPLEVGEVLPTEPFANNQDVTAPVAGTNTGEVPIPARRTEVDVRVGNPDDPQPAYPWVIGSAGGGRTMAAIRLARLQIAAGVASGEDLVVAAGIEKDASYSDEMINREIGTLEAVASASSRQGRPAHLVPRAASVQRTSPSLVSAPSMSATAGLSDDGDAEDIFL